MFWLVIYRVAMHLQRTRGFALLGNYRLCVQSGTYPCLFRGVLPRPLTRCNIKEIARDPRHPSCLENNRKLLGLERCYGRRFGDRLRLGP